MPENMKKSSHLILNMIIRANSLDNCRKSERIREILIETENLNIYSRIACDLKILSSGKLYLIVKKLESIETQSAGWIQWLENN
jgi:hypothetical protein